MNNEKQKSDIDVAESIRWTALSPAEKIENLEQLGFKERALMALGQDPRSVLYRAPATEPRNLAEMIEAGDYIPHPSGKFVRP